MKKMTFIIIITSIVLSNCSLFLPDRDKDNIFEYIPNFSEGDTYHFQCSLITIYTDTGDTTNISYTYDKAIHKTIENDSFLYYSLVNDHSDSEHYMYDKEKGILSFSNDSIFSDNDNYIILKTPVEVGNSWTDDQDHYYKIKRIDGIFHNNNITVYDVIFIEMTFNNSNATGTVEYYYSPSIGMVKIHTSSQWATFNIEDDVVLTRIVK